MTGPSGGIGGLPVAPAVDFNCKCCGQQIDPVDGGGGGGGGGCGEFDVTYDNGLDELTIVSLGGFDFTPVVTINYTGNGNGQITDPPHFSKIDPSTIVVTQAAFFLNGGVLTKLDFFVGPTVADCWEGSVLLA